MLPTLIETASNGRRLNRQSSPSINWREDNIQLVATSWGLTAEEEQKLRVLGTKLSDIEHWCNEPTKAIQFLSSPQCHYNVDKAEKMFRNMIQWRLDNEIDRILIDYKPPEKLLGFTPSAILAGVDHEGDPIYVERGGAVNPNEICKWDRTELARYNLYIKELHSSGYWVQEWKAQQKRAIKGVTIIYDLKGLSSRHLKCLDLFQQNLKITQDYYPGKFKRIIVINPNFAFSAIWSVAKHCLLPSARAKIMFVCGKKSYLDVLDQYLDRSVLPHCINPESNGTSAIGTPPLYQGDVCLSADSKLMRMNRLKQEESGLTSADSDTESVVSTGTDGSSIESLSPPPLPPKRSLSIVGERIASGSWRGSLEEGFEITHENQGEIDPWW